MATGYCVYTISKGTCAFLRMYQTGLSQAEAQVYVKRHKAPVNAHLCYGEYNERVRKREELAVWRRSKREIIMAYINPDGRPE